MDKETLAKIIEWIDANETEHDEVYEDLHYTVDSAKLLKFLVKLLPK